MLKKSQGGLRDENTLGAFGTGTSKKYSFLPGPYLVN